MKLESLVLSGQTCRYHITDGPVFVMPVAELKEYYLDSVLTFLRKEYMISDIGIFMYEVPDWNQDLQSHPAVTCTGSFSKKDDSTLKWLEKSAIPFIRLKTDRPLIYIGDSLFGQVPMWCTLQSGLFSGFISCSKVTEYSKWNDSTNTATAQTDCYVYMSLGIEGKKPETSNLTSLEKTTLQQQMCLVKDRHVIDSCFRCKPDADFNESEEIAHGIAWMLKHMRITSSKEALEYGEQTKRQGKKRG